MFLYFHVVVNNMIIGLNFAFELVDNIVYLLDFLIESYYYMMLGFVFFSILFISCIWLKKIWLINML